MKKREILVSIIIILALAILSYLSVNSFKLTPYAIISSNLEVIIPSDYQSIPPGSEIWFTTKLMNLADLGRRDVTLKYEILNENKNSIVSKSETVAVQTQASFVASLQIPADIPIGDYTLKVTLIDTNSPEDLESEASFKIRSAEKDYTIYYYAVALLLAFLLIILLIPKLKTRIERAKLKSKIRQIVRKKLQNSS
jgi:hypothetical protein